ncbi:class I SAM-dependent methyltransferase [Gemmobacter serpentinus]|uniref:class I SAM-dependent methyltransferase n=1 Tax=Gemmobacter serpentinus TaxID=2652247 RepID=UPI00124CB1C2|nr:class I SAM-dependent methyltransferase [Gemmobacter serpentinus]
MRLEIDIGAEAGSDAIAALDLSAFDKGDLLNLILQRSEVMYDRPRSGRIIKAWNGGDDGPINAVIEDMGEAIARRAAGVIHAEYRALQPVLAELAPNRIADIGCGYALFDLFAARDLGSDILLIDLESNEHRHFGFAQEGAAYSSLAVARRILEDNGVLSTKIATLNPRDERPEDGGPVDLAVSFLSCGFHYPVDLYLPFIETAITADGAAIFDLREATATEQAAKLATFGSLTDLPAPPKARRVLLRKGRVA